jgi:hypothetical protein
VGGIKMVLGGIDPDVGCLASIKLGEQWLEPVRMLVVDGYWLLWFRHTFLNVEGRLNEQPKGNGRSS